jgi:hypothetical protein
MRNSPKFTAEQSLYGSRGAHHRASAVGAISGASVAPQFPTTVGVAPPWLFCLMAQSRCQQGDMDYCWTWWAYCNPPR